MSPEDPIVHEILHALTRIEARNENADARMERVERHVEELDHAVRGNGSPGLREKHVSLEERVNGMAKVQKWAVGAVTTAGIGFLGWVLNLIFG